jgi:hypothetical protein
MKRPVKTFTHRRLLALAAAGMLAVSGVAITATASAQTPSVTTICNAVPGDQIIGVDGRTMLVCVVVSHPSVAVDRINFDEHRLVGLGAPVEGGMIEAALATADRNAAIERHNLDAMPGAIELTGR